MAKVNWTFQALEDLADIGEYHEANSSKYASFLIDLLFEKATHLANFPHMGRKVPELNIDSIRELIIKNYRIIYSVPDSETIDILVVRHSSKPLEDVF